MKPSAHGASTQHLPRQTAPHAAACGQGSVFAVPGGSRLLPASDGCFRDRDGTTSIGYAVVCWFIPVCSSWPLTWVQDS